MADHWHPGALGLQPGEGTPHPDEDLVLDLALGQLSGPERDTVLAHVGDCPQCRADLDALTAAIESTLAAVPRAEPGPDFTAGVLEQCGALPGPDAAGAGHAGPGPTTWRPPTWAVAAAAAIIGLATGAGLTSTLGGPGQAPDTETPAVTVVAGAALTTADGTRVGTVSHSWSEGSAVLVVDIAGGEPGRRYLCRLITADGQVHDVGAWTLAPDRPNNWVVPDPGAVSVELVSESGAVWSSATL